MLITSSDECHNKYSSPIVEKALLHQGIRYCRTGSRKLQAGTSYYSHTLIFTLLQYRSVEAAPPSAIVSCTLLHCKCCGLCPVRAMYPLPRHLLGHFKSAGDPTLPLRFAKGRSLYTLPKSSAEKRVMLWCTAIGIVLAWRLERQIVGAVAHLLSPGTDSQSPTR